MIDYSLIKNLWQFISLSHRKKLFLYTLIMPLASLAEVFSIGIVLPFLSVLIDPKNFFENPLVFPLVKFFNYTEPKELVLLLTFFFVIAILFSCLMRLLLLYLQSRLSHEIGASLGVQIYEKTLYQPYCKHIARNSSVVIAGINSKTAVVIGGVVMPILQMISSTLTFFSIFLILVAVQPFLTLVAFFCFGGLYGLIIFITKKSVEKNSNKANQQSSFVIKALQEGLGGIRDIIIDGSQTIYCKIYENAELSLRKSQAKINFISASPKFIIEALGIVSIALFAFMLTNEENTIKSAIPIIGALVVGAQRLLPVLHQLYSSITAMYAGRSYLKDVVELLNQPLPKYLSQGKIQLNSFEKSIKLEKVSFRYKKSLSLVLNNIDLEIYKGCRLGIMGKTGDGKSTLIDIIMGLLEPSQGRLLVDDKTLTTRNYHCWQKHIAHVPQAIFLNDSTILENIAFGIKYEEIDLERVKWVATLAQIANTIESWEEKYQTKVGERGVRLSGGQIQRIGIARALYKKPDVLVLDEATSALDLETESAIMEQIDQLKNNITIIMVAHRLSTLKSCDQIIWLENGVIKKTGSYKQMIAASKRREKKSSNK